MARLTRTSFKPPFGDRKVFDLRARYGWQYGFETILLSQQFADTFFCQDMVVAALPVQLTIPPEACVALLID